MSTDPTALAREVLDAAELHDGTPANEADLREERWEFYQDLCTSQATALARAVIDLTAKVERVEALADRLEASASELEADGADDYAEAAITDATHIRAALNGDNK